MRGPTILAAIGAALLLAPAGTAGVSAARLSLMPLPRSAFGQEAAALELASESGAVTNADAAEDTTRRNDTAATLRRLGRLTGHQVIFADYGRIGTHGKLVFAVSDVTLFRDADAATLGHARSLRENVTDDPAAGLKLLDMETFSAPRLGDHADGLRVKVRFGSVTVWMTGVQFHRGKLVASVALMRTDASSQEAAVRELARRLDARIDGVLASRVTTPPAKTAPAAATAPKGVEPKADVSTAALTRGDVGGAKVERQGHVADDASVSTYERVFGSGKLGKAQLINVENGVSLLATPARARATIGAMPGLLRDGTFLRETLTRELGRDGGLELEEMTVLGQGTVNLGDAKGYRVVVRVTVAIGTFDAAYAFVQSGRFLGWFSVVSGFGMELADADVVRLSNRFANRIGRASRKLSTPIA